ncbi:MAG: ABC transporter permease [Candidatus Dojkabacteria bacterium]
MSKTTIIVKREYFKVVKKPTFWVATLLLPLFIVIISLVSGFSAQQAEDTNKRNLEAEKGSQVLILDESNLINPKIFINPNGTVSARFIANKDEGIQEIKDAKEPVFVYYPKDLVQGAKIEIYVTDKGLFGNSRYDSYAIDWINQSIITNLPADLQVAYKAQLTTETRAFSGEKEIDTSPTKLILPAAFALIYIILTSFATSYLLMSVSEEKENRVMEIVLSNVKPRELITGKILGQVGVVITQVLILGILSALVVFVFKDTLTPVGLNIGAISFSFEQILLSIFYTILSFFILACVMVGVGAAMPTYKEAQSFSTVFVMVSIMPFYFVSILIAEPSGIIAQVLSYFPLSSGIVLLFRNALGVLSPLEIIVSSILLVIYAYIALYLAFKLFEFGSLEYGRKISFKDFFKSIRR